MATPAATSAARLLRSPAATRALPSPPARLARYRRRLPSVRAEAAKEVQQELQELRSAGVSVYKPRSYEVLVSDAARSLAAAIDDGRTRLEIEFPYANANCFLS